MRLSRNPRLLAAVAVAVVALSACGGTSGAAPSTPGQGVLKVVTTTTVFADIVQSIGGSRVTVTSIIPPGVGPEDFEPKPDDVKKLADARLVVSNGIGLDAFLDRLLSSAGGGQPRLVLGDGIPAIVVDGKSNPHFWLDPSLVKQYYVPKIAAKLAELDPA